jgi:hypothetical protein
MSFQFPDDLFAPGTTSVREQIQAFTQELTNKQTEYVNEVTEYNKLVADFTTITKKMKFADVLARQNLLVSPDVLLEYNNAIVQGFSLPVRVTGLVTSGISLAARIAVLLKSKGVITAAKSIQRVNKFAKVGKITAAFTVVLGIVELVLDITNAQLQKQKLEEEKSRILDILNEVKSNIEEVNSATKDVIKALLGIFADRKINSEGIFNANEDGIADETKYRKAINDVQNSLNGLIGSLGADAQKKKTAARTIERKLQRRRTNNQSLELPEDDLNDIASDSELSLEIIKLIYAEQLLKMGLSVEEVVQKSGQSVGDVRDLYAVQLLKTGKTVETSAQLSGVIVERVQQLQYELNRLAAKRLEEGMSVESVAQDLELLVEQVQKVEQFQDDLSKLAADKLNNGQSVEDVAKALDLPVERVQKIKDFLGAGSN